MGVSIQNINKIETGYGSNSSTKVSIFDLLWININTHYPVTTVSHWVYLVDSSHHQEAVSDDDGGGGASGEGHGCQPLPLLLLRMKGLGRVQRWGLVTWRTRTDARWKHQSLHVLPYWNDHVCRSWRKIGTSGRSVPVDRDPWPQLSSNLGGCAANIQLHGHSRKSPEVITSSFYNVNMTLKLALAMLVNELQGQRFSSRAEQHVEVSLSETADASVYNS